LIKNKITNLICIGGDGTLIGANCLKEEWSEILQKLLENCEFYFKDSFRFLRYISLITLNLKAEITLKEKNESMVLNLVGVVATIDNDFYGTDMTIGANSALHRIIECIDNLITTAFRLIIFKFIYNIYKNLYKILSHYRY